MAWWVWVLVIVALGVLTGLMWWSSGRTPNSSDHHRGRQPGQLDNRGWS
jgi:hypothetical protein